jgi:IclR-like helix-turn-helix domain-containing protein
LASQPEHDGGREVTITLTRAQVDRVVRRAPKGEGAAGRLRPLSGGAAAGSRYRELAESPRLSRSLLLGLLVLASFPSDGSATAVTDVAAQLDMSPSTTHRYLSTLLAVGLLEQDPRTRRYHVPNDG